MSPGKMTLIGACLRKFRYGRKAAEKAVAKMEAKGKKVTMYKCPFCPAYHITHAPDLPEVKL